MVRACQVGPKLPTILKAKVNTNKEKQKREKSFLLYVPFLIFMSEVEKAAESLFIHGCNTLALFYCKFLQRCICLLLVFLRLTMASWSFRIYSTFLVFVFVNFLPTSESFVECIK